MISNEQLSAYVDGELPPEEMERVRQAVQGDELLAARLRKFAQVDGMIAAFARGIDDEPLPRALCDRLGIDDAQRTAPVSTVALSPAPPAASPSRGLPRWRLPAALAAGLVVALFAGLRLGGGRSAGEGFDSLALVGPVPAASPLALALERVASDDSQVAGPDYGLRITPQLSFVSAREGVCREFRLDAEDRAARGLACRRDAGWQTLRVAATTVRAEGGEGFETATIDGDAGFEAFVDALIDTAPLDPEQEARLMQRGWQPD